MPLKQKLGLARHGSSGKRLNNNLKVKMSILQTEAAFILAVALSKGKTVILGDNIYITDKWDHIPRAQTCTSVPSTSQT